MTPSPQVEEQTSGSAPEQLKPISMAQLEHPSFATKFPSSHYSLIPHFEFPQTEGNPVHMYPCSGSPSKEQPSPEIKLLSSHSSEPTIIPSPYLGMHISFETGLPPEQTHEELTDMQSEAQPSPLVSPSSHISEVFRMEFPHSSQKL